MSLRLVVLISGNGSNLQAILDACEDGRLDARVVGVISNRADALGLARAEQRQVPVQVLPPAEHPDREAYDAALAAAIERWQPDVVVLAGFMRILSAGFVQRFHGRLLNIHPSLLPQHKGLHTHQRVLDAGDAEHGCSVHFVTPALDDGPVIAQGVTPVHPQDTPDTLAERVHHIEHRLYPLVLSWLAAGRLDWRGDGLYLDGTPLPAPVRQYFT